MANRVEPKTLAELEAMHTGSLMSRRRALLKCAESFEPSGDAALPKAGVIQYKDTPEWKRAYGDLKAVLDTRENIANKKERKALRQAKARSRR
ncbi:hypothetical protein FCL40_15735 [Ferrimonas sediminicola]|uniref:Uncharacterized protein n=1 Tax=Ferrimonas sediminicola TaxID=2569538 RepID=A0A4U1B9E0_9GAMM|nr:hypothetical protein [Ferrimonas sediminicola]TKB47301.1 hypothetical protein FCL40_15735 [Ferrimonas sediminicola]